MIDIADFERLDVRVGTVTDAKPFPEARRPAYRLWIDFGPDIGTKQAHLFRGRRGGAVDNRPPRQVGPFTSEVLTLGLPDENGEVVLIKPDFKLPDGGRLY